MQLFIYWNNSQNNSRTISSFWELRFRLLLCLTKGLFIWRRVDLSRRVTLHAVPPQVTELSHISLWIAANCLHQKAWGWLGEGWPWLDCHSFWNKGSVTLGGEIETTFSHINCTCLSDILLACFAFLAHCKYSITCAKAKWWKASTDFNRPR